MRRLWLLLMVLILLFVACTRTPAPSDDMPTQTPTETASIAPSLSPIPTPIPTPLLTPEPKPYSLEELGAMALTLAGECYDDKEHDKRLVCEVILNRVSDGRFGDGIIGVLTAKNQFSGYWKQSRPVSESDVHLAEETLNDWFKNDCVALSEYLFFSAGQNRENKFH